MERPKMKADFDIRKNTFLHARLARLQEGVREVGRHANGGTLIFSGYGEEFVELLHQRPAHGQSRGRSSTGGAA